MAGSKQNQNSGISELTFEQIAFQAHNQMDETQNWYVLGGSADFSAILPKLRLIKEGDEVAILIRPFIHNMVIYMRVMDGKIKCFIADSQGWNWRYYPTRNLIAALNSRFGEKAQIFLPSTSLQAKDVNRGCAVFAQKFLKYFLEEGKVFYQELASLPIKTEENQRLKEKIKDSGIALRSEIVLLQKNSLPTSLISRLEQNFSTPDSSPESSPWLKETMTIQSSLLMEQDNEFEKETQNISVTNEEKMHSLLKWQHLDLEDLKIGVEESPIYQLEINKIDEKYAFKVTFGKGKSGKNQIMFGNCIMYANVNFPKDVTSDNLQTIFTDIKPEIKMDMHESSLTIYGDSEEELLTFFSQKLLSPEYQLQLYRQGMTQHLALHTFAYEALECLKMRQRKDVTSGGLFLGEINAALLYFINAYGRDTIGVVQESLGFGNEKLPQKIINLLEGGKGKVIFSIDANETHQVAVIVDKKNKKISVIDSAGLDQGSKSVEKLLGDHSYFEAFTFSSEPPPVLQARDHWTCGVHVILNILDALGEIPDRKNIDMDEWLRKILRASEVTERENLLRQDKMSVRDNLIDIVIGVHEKNEFLMPTLIPFLKSDVKDSSLITFGELKQQEKYKSLNLTEKENDVLRLIYSLTEANFEKGVAEELVGSGLKFIARSESGYVEFKEKSKKNSDLATQTSNLLEEQHLNEHLEQLKSISSKKSKLIKWLQSLISQELTIKDLIDSESLGALISWLRKEGNKPNISTEKLYSWLDYLLLNKLNLMVIELLESERNASNEARRQKHSIETLRNEEIQLCIDKISKLLGLQETQEHKDIVQWLSELKGKLFLITPQGWEKIIRAARFDIKLLNTIIKDHENTEYLNFFLSAIKTLSDQGEEKQVLELCHSSYIQENLKENFGILEAGLLLPISKQEKFLQNNLKAIMSYFVFLNQQTGKPVPTESLETLSEFTAQNVMRLFVQMINHQVFDDYIKVLELLPASLNVYLLELVTPPIATIEQLGIFLLTLPETRRLAVIKTYQHLIEEQYLAPVIGILSSYMRYDFLNDYLKSQPKTYLFDDDNFLEILKNLSSNDIDKLVQNYPQFLSNIHVLSGVIKNVVNHRAIHYAETYQRLIVSVNDLQKILLALPSEHHSKVIDKNSQLIITPSDASLIAPFISPDKKAAFIEKYKTKITTIKDVITLAQNLPEGKKWEFIKPYIRLIKDGYELAQIATFYQDDTLDFITKRIDLVGSGGELLAVLRVVQHGFVNIIDAFKNSLFSKPITKDQTEIVGKILLFIPQEKRRTYATKFSNDIPTIGYLSALLITLKEEDRLQCIKVIHKANSSFDFQSSEQIGKTLFILPVHDRIPFLEELLALGVIKSLAEKSKFSSMDILMYLSSSSNSEMISAEDKEAIKQKLDSVIITVSSSRDFGFYSKSQKRKEELPEEPKNKKEFR